MFVLTKDGWQKEEYISHCVYHHDVKQGNSMWRSSEVLRHREKKTIKKMWNFNTWQACMNCGPNTTNKKSRSYNVFYTMPRKPAIKKIDER